MLIFADLRRCFAIPRKLGSEDANCAGSPGRKVPPPGRTVDASIRKLYQIKQHQSCTISTFLRSSIKACKPCRRRQPW